MQQSSGRSCRENGKLRVASRYEKTGECRVSYPGRGAALTDGPQSRGHASAILWFAGSRLCRRNADALRLVRDRRVALPSTPSSRVGRSDTSSDLPPLLAFHDSDVVLPLQVQPELRAVTEIAAKPHRGICRNASASVQNVGNPPRGNADVERKPVGAQPTRHEFALEQPSGMHEWSHGCQPL